MTDQQYRARVRYVIGPDGSPLTVADLPPKDTKRWVIRRKAEVVAPVRGGLLSPYPDLKKLDRRDNLQVTVDFRSVYASLLEQWMQTDAGAVIPDSGSLDRVPMIWT